MSSDAGGGLAISGILVSAFSDSVAPAGVPSPEPRLRITRPGRRARFDGTDLRLTPRSFDLLVILAEGMLQSAAPVGKRHLEDRLLVGNFSEKAIGQAVNRLKSELMKSGVCRENARSFIENVRAVGYRLLLPTSDIRYPDRRLNRGFLVTGHAEIAVSGEPSETFLRPFGDLQSF